MLHCWNPGYIYQLTFPTVSDRATQQFVKTGMPREWASREWRWAWGHGQVPPLSLSQVTHNPRVIPLRLACRALVISLCLVARLASCAKSATVSLRDEYQPWRERAEEPRASRVVDLHVSRERRQYTLVTHAMPPLPSPPDLLRRPPRSTIAAALSPALLATSRMLASTSTISRGQSQHLAKICQND